MHSLGGARRGRRRSAHQIATNKILRARARTGEDTRVNAEICALIEERLKSDGFRQRDWGALSSPHAMHPTLSSDILAMPHPLGKKPHLPKRECDCRYAHDTLHCLIQFT